MGFWDDISRKVSYGTKVVTQKSGELFEIAKVRMDVASEKDKIGRLYEEIGKVMYKDYKAGNLKQKEIIEKCQLIDELNYKIKRLNQKVVQIKGGSLCRKCGEVVDASQRYCHTCGRELERAARVVDEGANYRVEVANGSMCGKCGALVQEGSEFCPSCGNKT
jgi:RNA polymerase subunit RPABC4/transcription elongation factor Spt4